MIRTGVYVHEDGHWVAYRGPGFLSEQKAEEWAVSAVDDSARRGVEATAITWDRLTGETLFQTRCLRVGSVN